MKRTIEWRDVNALLARRVPAGCVTSYKALSQHLYGRMLIHPLTSLLKACSSNAAVDLSHRVVMEDGALSPERPGGAPRQTEQLLAEGVTFTQDGRVDLTRTWMVDFKD
jgi:alkylated DNA nucleotide flippase Atl1